MGIKYSDENKTLAWVCSGASPFDCPPREQPFLWTYPHSSNWVDGSTSVGELITAMLSVPSTRAEIRLSQLTVRSFVVEPKNQLTENDNL